MFGNRMKSLGMAIALGLMGTAGAGVLMRPSPITQSVPGNAARKTVRSGSGSPYLRSWNYPGAGTTMAQQQRASRKARNVKRARAAGRA